MPRTEDQPTVTLARDEFTSERRRLDGHPEAVKASSRIDVVDDYDNTTTWIVDLYRLRDERKKATELVALVQRITGNEGVRFVIPAQVTDAFIRHASGLVTKHRQKVGRRVAADKKAQGLPVGNPEALKLARKARRHK